jgi:hypothetical protein
MQKLNVATIIIKIHVENNHCSSDKFVPNIVTTSAIKLSFSQCSARLKIWLHGLVFSSTY